MLDGLLNVLNGLTDIGFVEGAWSHAPDTKYGVITLDGQKELKTGRSMISEKMLHGYVDVFEKKPKSLATPNSVEAALSRLGIYFALESVQFEADTGYVHWEWRWVDTLNVVARELYVVRFDGIDGIISEQIVQAGEMPVIPAVADAVVDGIRYVFIDWDKPVTETTQNTVYTAQYYVYVLIRKTGSLYYARNNADFFTPDQVSKIVSWFDNGNAVGCLYSGTTYYATDVTMQYVRFDGKTAGWA